MFSKFSPIVLLRVICVFEPHVRFMPQLHYVTFSETVSSDFYARFKDVCTCGTNTTRAGAKLTSDRNVPRVISLILRNRETCFRFLICFLLVELEIDSGVHLQPGAKGL